VYEDIFDINAHINALAIKTAEFVFPFM